MAIDISFEGLVGIVLGISAAITGLFGWMLKNNTKQTRMEDRTYRNEQDINELRQWLKEEREESKKEHEKIWKKIESVHEELHALSKMVHNMEGKLK